MPVQQKSTCNFIKRMTTGALKNHWSTENQLRRNAFNVHVHVVLKRETVAALCKLKHFGP